MGILTANLVTAVKSARLALPVVLQEFAIVWKIMVEKRAINVVLDFIVTLNANVYNVTILNSSMLK